MEANNGSSSNNVLREPGERTQLSRKAFQGNSCPSYLGYLSRVILKRCDGLPRAIVAISSPLSTKGNSLDEWDKIYRGFGAELEGNDKLKSLNLWVAEGFVEGKEGLRIELVAESYINELINRNLVQVAEKRKDGRLKAYQIHDLWREMVVSKSREQNIASTSSANKVLCLAVDNSMGDIQSNDFTRLHSLLMFSVEDPLSMLSKLWVADGFVKGKEGLRIELVAESYINELINRSLVQVAEKRKDGRLKAYRIHDLWREMVVSMSREQNIASINRANKVRCLTIDNSVGDIQSNDFTRLCSLLMFSVEDPLSMLSKKIVFLSPEINLVESGRRFVEWKEGLRIEEVVESYINELINRSLVQVSEKRIDGRLKAYRIHDLWREIVVSKSRKQNIVSINCADKVRCLAMDNSMGDIQRNDFTRLRSLLMFSVEDPLSMLFKAMSLGDGVNLLTVLDLSDTQKGFVEGNEGLRIEEVAESYIKELINRSLVQVAEKRKDGRLKAYRIHDLWCEMVVSKSREQNIGSINSADKLQCLAIDNSMGDIQRNDFSRLRSLFIFSVEDPLSMSSMSCTQFQTFSNEIVKLVHLTHLSLRDTKVKFIPNSIGNLKNIETLDLKDTDVKELPVEILKLRHLHHLLLYRYRERTITSYCILNHDGFKAIKGLGSLESLQKLCSMEANHGSNSNIMLRELGKLTQLRRLSIKDIFGDFLSSYLGDLLRVILKRCDDLPPAIVAVGGLLSAKGNSLDEWIWFTVALERNWKEMTNSRV
ncbi:hypothetical protein Vadar_024873 [Vaccinium darrowii]|uniref:Uncharacterized protein n=1 Tax=Vaccinium darrowii TaxID=229202 RepID=A0ACB7YHZ3_9ERIC|nr:hypothetical protein Vadar_024873 [Vaccinium darrowii]